MRTLHTVPFSFRVKELTVFPISIAYTSLECAPLNMLHWTVSELMRGVMKFKSSVFSALSHF